MKDWHLIAATLVLTGISVVLLTLEAAVPQLRGEVNVEEDGERAFGTTVYIIVTASGTVCRVHFSKIGDLYHLILLMHAIMSTIFDK